MINLLFYPYRCPKIRLAEILLTFQGKTTLFQSNVHRVNTIRQLLETTTVLPPVTNKNVNGSVNRVKHFSV